MHVVGEVDGLIAERPLGRRIVEGDRACLRRGVAALAERALRAVVEREAVVTPNELGTLFLPKA